MNNKSSLLSIILFLLSVISAKAQSNGQPTDETILKKTILSLDSAFWEAYNRCDVNKMDEFFTTDIEFYHDKGGLTSSLETLSANTRKGLCGNENFRLRREVVGGTVNVFPLNNYGAILSGEHVFYIVEKGKPERLDGLAKFTHVWRFSNSQWKMHRILSYDHKPAYVNQRKEITIDQALLTKYAGKYESPGSGVVTLQPENTLKLSAGDFNMVLYPESPTRFFAKERDLQFEFVTEKNSVTKMVVYEGGKKVDEAKRQP
jgi:hypothetical protein